MILEIPNGYSVFCSWRQRLHQKIVEQRAKVLGKGNNRALQGRSYSYGNLGQRYNPTRDFKMKNGAIVLARDFNYDDNARKGHFRYSFLTPPYQAKDIFSRYLQWSSNYQGSLLNTKSLEDEDLRESNNLLRMRSWQTQDKVSTPRQVHENGSHEIRSSQFLEEKKWPPCEFITNQWEEKRADICSAKNSQYLLQQNLGQLYSKWNCRYNTLEQNLVTPFTIETKEDEEKEWLREE